MECSSSAARPGKKKVRGDDKFVSSFSRHLFDVCCSRRRRLSPLFRDGRGGELFRFIHGDGGLSHHHDLHQPH